MNAVEIAKGMEAAEKNSQQLKGTEAQIQPVHGTREEDQVRICYRCGNSGHTPANCRFKESKCFNCEKKGHLSRVCRAKRKEPNPRRQPSTHELLADVS